MPDVSVIIPAYNQPGMLGEALRGVQDQISPAAEIIVIDDCSETPLELATSFSTQLPVRFIRHSRNLGPAASVVHGIREARCALIAILNHDDTWEPEFLQRLTQALSAHPEACFAFCDHGIMRADGRHDERRSDEQSVRYTRADLPAGTLAGARLYQAALLDKAVATSSFALVRRGALDLSLIGAGADMWDYFLAVGACRTGAPAIYVAERLGWYRVSPTMLSATHADPKKQIAMAQPQIAILVVILRSQHFRAIRRAACWRVGLVIRHALANAIRARSIRGLGRTLARLIAGVVEGQRLSREDHAGGNPMNAP
jgi:glycosyltransferase involved in cell wall biosynthesis